MQELLARLRPYRVVITLTVGTVIGLLFAVWAHAWPVTTVTFDGTTVDCGSLLSPRTDVGPRADFLCSSSLLDREVPRLFGLLVAVGFGLALASVALFARSGQVLWRDLRVVNGPTAVRSARRGDRRRIGSTIDEVVIGEMGWAPEHVRIVSRNIGRGRRSPAMMVTESVADRPIGAITVGARSSVEGGVELGGWIGPSNRRQGHMTRAIEAVADYWVGRGVPVFAECSAANEPALHILHAAGFKVIGQRDARLPNGTELEATIHARFPDISTPDPGPQTGDV